MNRENKRKKYEKGYYKNHPCQESFTCKVCGRLVTPAALEAITATTAPTAFPPALVDIEPGTGRLTAAALWSPWPCGCAKGESGPSSTGAAGAGPFPPTVQRRMTTP